MFLRCVFGKKTLLLYCQLCSVALLMMLVSNTRGLSTAHFFRRRDFLSELLDSKSHALKNLFIKIIIQFKL